MDLNLIVIIAIIILISMIFIREEREKFLARIMELHNFHEEKEDLYGQYCYLRGYSDGASNKPVDYQKVKEENKKEVENESKK